MLFGEVMSDGSESKFGFRSNRNDHMTMTVPRRRSEDEDGGKAFVKAEINTPPSLGWRKGNEDEGFSSEIILFLWHHARKLSPSLTHYHNMPS